MEDEHARLLGYALRLLGRREYSQVELRTRLKQWLERHKILGSSATERIEAVLAQLAQEGWQDDERFAAAYTRLSIRKGWGPIKIGYHLKHKGIAMDRISQHCDYSEEFWVEQLSKLLEHRYKGVPTDARNREQRYRFLLGRGFLPPHIRVVLHFSH